MYELETFETCPDAACGVAVGQLHLNDCNIARCKACGEQAFLCSLTAKHSSTVFKGEFPGTSQAIERGWFVRMVDGEGWVQCLQTDPGARPDLNRLYSELNWNSELEIFE
jgi:hypothetical protein